MNVQIPPATSCPERTRNPDAFPAPPGRQAFSRRNQIWKPPPLFWPGTIFRRRVSLEAAIFFLRQRNGKPDTPARVEHRASLRLQTREPILLAAALAVVEQPRKRSGLPSLSRPRQAAEAPVLQEILAGLEIFPRRARDAPRGRPR